MNSLATLNQASARAETKPLPAAMLGKSFAPALGTTVSFKRNQTIFDEGESAKYAYRIIDGFVRQCVLLPDGRRQIIDFLSPGDVIGLSDIDFYDFRAEAVTDIIVARIPKSTQADAERSRDTAENMRAQLCRAKFHAIMLGRQTVKERVASFFIRIAERQTSNLKNGYSLNLPMGRQDIADYLGLTLETVCRTIGALKRDKVIDVPNTHQIIIKDVALLEAVAEGDA